MTFCSFYLFVFVLISSFIFLRKQKIERDRVREQKSVAEYGFCLGGLPPVAATLIEGILAHHFLIQIGSRNTVF